MIDVCKSACTERFSCEILTTLVPTSKEGTWAPESGHLGGHCCPDIDRRKGGQKSKSGRGRGAETLKAIFKLYTFTYQVGQK